MELFPEMATILSLRSIRACFSFFSSSSRPTKIFLSLLNMSSIEVVFFMSSLFGSQARSPFRGEGVF